MPLFRRGKPMWKKVIGENGLFQYWLPLAERQRQILLARMANMLLSCFRLIWNSVVGLQNPPYYSVQIVPFPVPTFSCNHRSNMT